MMAENKMAQVAEMFGKKLDEVFTVTYVDMVVNANFTSQGLCVGDMSWEYGARVLSMMLLGEAEIVEE